MRGVASCRGFCLLFVEHESYFVTLISGLELDGGGSGGTQAERAGARTARLGSGEHEHFTWLF